MYSLSAFNETWNFGNKDRTAQSWWKNRDSQIVWKRMEQDENDLICICAHACISKCIWIINK